MGQQDKYHPFLNSQIGTRHPGATEIGDTQSVDSFTTPGKDTTKTRGYSPVSLMNIDSSMLNKTFAKDYKRKSKVLPTMPMLALPMK